MVSIMVVKAVQVGRRVRRNPPEAVARRRILDNQSMRPWQSSLWSEFFEEIRTWTWFPGLVAGDCVGEVTEGGAGLVLLALRGCLMRWRSCGMLM